MTEGVVVELEAVQVVNREETRLGCRAFLERALEVGDEAPPVAETRESIGDGLVAHQPEDLGVLAEGEPGPNHDAQERRAREDRGEEVQPVELVVAEDDQADESAHDRRSEQGPAFEVDGRAAGLLPRSR